jgi:hypothetical protein
MTKLSKIGLPLLLASSILSGCTTTHGLYQWGSYESQIYSAYAEPGSTPPETQLANLEKDYQLLLARNANPPPGFHAYLGYLYFQTGKTDRALQSFETEKRLFPESRVYMDRLIARLSH